MIDTITRFLSAIPDAATRRAVRNVVRPGVDRLSSQALTTAGLVINGAGATFAKTGAAPCYACAAGKLVMIPAGTALPAPTGLAIPAGSTAVASFYTDSAGNITMQGSTPAALLPSVTWPEPLPGQALIGLLIITASGAFTGGTTALDATTTTVFVSPVFGCFDPTALV